MKGLNEFIIEGEEWNPSLNSHKEVWNSLVKWYDKAIKKLDSHIITDMLEQAAKDMRDDCFDVLK